jgi:hypothetical protein
MAESDKLFVGSIPKMYDTLMVPLIFQDYAADTAQLVAAGSPGAVLETAAGSGVVTRMLGAKNEARRVLRGDRPEPAHARLRCRPAGHG